MFKKEVRIGEKFIGNEHPCFIVAEAGVSHFGSLLYVLMGISLWLLWRANPDSWKNIALIFFLTQLTFNALWSYLFFGSKQIGFALADIFLLGFTILLTIIFSWPVSKLASGLLMPYFLWILFASVLNFVIWRLNPQ